MRNRGAATTHFRSACERVGMAEELREDSLAAQSRDDATTLAAWRQSMDLMDRVVEDVNGARLGRVTKCFAEEGTLMRCEVSLDANAKGVFGRIARRRQCLRVGSRASRTTS